MFKVGDRVKLSINSKFWMENSSSNPRNVEGVVVIDEYTTDFKYRVKWENERTNCYNDRDLVLVQTVKPKGISAFIKRVEYEYGRPSEKEYSNVKTA